MDFKDYYATLGVPKTASEKEVKQAFRKMARKHHPDVNPGDKAAESRFKEINEAYEVIGDPEKRKKYDELGSNWKMYEQAQPTAAGDEGGAGHYRTMTADEMRDLFGNEDPFSDFFHAFFSAAASPICAAAAGARARAAHAPARAATSSTRSTSRSKTPITGTTRRLTLKHDGRSRTVDVRIPAGVGEGSRVRVSGEGEQGSGGASSGDLYLRLHIPPDSRFERKGQDLHAKVRVPVTTAVLGRRSGSPESRRQALSAQDSVRNPKRPGVPSKGTWHAFRRQAGRVWRPLCHRRGRAARQLTPEERTHYEALAKLARGKSSAA